MQTFKKGLYSKKNGKKTSLKKWLKAGYIESNFADGLSETMVTKIKNGFSGVIS
jgi:hypothetical protein